MTKSINLLFEKQTADGLVAVWQQDKCLRLTLDAIEQSRIKLDHPEQLSALLHQHFLVPLLFIETPKTVLLGGLGGGSLARFFHHKMPEIHGDAVEINNTIAQLAKQYFSFPETNWQLHVNDIRHWEKGQYDLIVIDIAEAELTPAWLTSEKMLTQLKKLLSSQGVLVINLLVADAQSFSQQLSKVRQVFMSQTLCLSVPEHKNIVIAAFNRKPEFSSINELKERASVLMTFWGIEFPVLIEQLVKDNPRGSGIF